MPGAYANVMFCLLVVGAGISVALQQVLNTNLRTELGFRGGRDSSAIWSAPS